jgi:hypothetical protein
VRERERSVLSDEEKRKESRHAGPYVLESGHLLGRAGKAAKAQPTPTT